MGSPRSSSWNRTRALWPTLIGALYLRDRGTCAYCGVALLDLFEIDHVRPRHSSRIPWNDPRNLVICCDLCNQRKGRGPVPLAARREVRNRTRRVLDYEAGRAKAAELYQWFIPRSEKRNARRRKRYSDDATSFDPTTF